MEFEIAAFRNEEVFAPFDIEDTPFEFDDGDAASGLIVSFPSRRRLDELDPAVFLGL
jgi:hypothetical protein